MEQVFTESVGRRRRGVPNDVLLKVRVIVRRVPAESPSCSGSGDSGGGLKVWRRRHLLVILFDTSSLEVRGQYPELVGAQMI